MWQQELTLIQQNPCKKVEQNQAGLRYPGGQPVGAVRIVWASDEAVGQNTLSGLWGREESLYGTLDEAWEIRKWGGGARGSGDVWARAAPASVALRRRLLGFDDVQWLLGKVLSVGGVSEMYEGTLALFLPLLVSRELFENKSYDN